MKLGVRSRTKPQLYFMLLGSLCVYTVIHNAFQLCFKCTQIQDCLDKGSPAPPALSL